MTSWKIKNKKSDANRQGLSLIELIVVIVVIGVLFAVVSVAILRTRHASTAIDCKNNIRQIGLATQGFIQARSILPYSRQLPGRRGMIHLLPYLEQNSLFEQLAKLNDDEVSMTTPSIFRCDADFLPYEISSLNYIPCGGIGSDSVMGNEVGFGYYGNHSLTQVIDGLSNTVFYSERMVADVNFPNSHGEAAKRFPIGVGDYFEVVEPFESTCWQKFNEGDILFVKSVTRSASIVVQYKFGTKFTPNGPSCEFFSQGQTPPDVDVSGWESYTPSSNHEGYVNVSFGDASVSSISNEIDPNVWRIVGSIAGRDGVFVP